MLVAPSRPEATNQLDPTMGSRPAVRETIRKQADQRQRRPLARRHNLGERHPMLAIHFDALLVLLDAADVLDEADLPTFASDVADIGGQIVDECGDLTPEQAAIIAS